MKEQIREIISELILIVRKNKKLSKNIEDKEVVDLSHDFSEEVEDIEARKYLENLSEEAIHHIYCIMYVGRDYCTYIPEGDTNISLDKALEKYKMSSKEAGIEKILEKEELVDFLEKGLSKLEL